MTRAGFSPPPFTVSIDGAWGWPYLAGAYRLGLGVWDGVPWGRLGIGLEVRSSVWVTEIDLRLAFGVRFARVIRIGAELGLGVAVGSYPGGIAPNVTPAGFILNLTVTEAIALRQVAFGITERLEFWVDTPVEINAGNTGLGRDINARVFVGGFVEIPVHRLVNIFVQADYAPKQAERHILCGDTWNGGCPHSWMRDINLNVQAGVGVRLR